MTMGRKTPGVKQKRLDFVVVFFFQHFGALEVWLSLEGKFGDTGDVSPEILPQGGGLCSPEDKIFHGTGWDDITKTQEIRNHVRLAKVQKLLNMGVSKN